MGVFCDFLHLGACRVGPVSAQERRYQSASWSADDSELKAFLTTEVIEIYMGDAFGIAYIRDVPFLRILLYFLFHA